MRPPGQEGEGAEKDSDIADVAAEVSTSAAQLGDQQNKKEEKDVEIADIAAEVGATAEKIEEQEQLKTDETPNPKAESRADTAAEVAESAAEVQATDERVADTASEAADAASAVPEPTPQPAAKPAAGGQPVRPASHSDQSKSLLLTARALATVLCQLLLNSLTLLCVCVVRLSTRFCLDGEGHAARSGSAEAKDQVGVLCRTFLGLERSARSGPDARCSAAKRYRTSCSSESFHEGSTDDEPRCRLSFFVVRFDERFRGRLEGRWRRLGLQRLLGGTLCLLQGARWRPCGALDRRGRQECVPCARKRQRRTQGRRARGAGRVQAGLHREGARDG